MLEPGQFMCHRQQPENNSGDLERAEEIKKIRHFADYLSQNYQAKTLQMHFQEVR
jgi:hypothetical protein